VAPRRVLPPRPRLKQPQRQLHFTYLASIHHFLPSRQQQPRSRGGRSRTARRRRPATTARPHEHISVRFLPTSALPRLPPSGARAIFAARAKVRPNLVVHLPRAPWPPLSLRCGRGLSAIPSSPTSTLSRPPSSCEPGARFTVPRRGRQRRRTATAARPHHRERRRGRSPFARPPLGCLGFGPKPEPGRLPFPPLPRLNRPEPLRAGPVRQWVRDFKGKK
jgi:hypothetical protein